MALTAMSIKFALLFLPLTYALRMSKTIDPTMLKTDADVQQFAPQSVRKMENGGSPVIWQKPKGPIKGILLWIPGCGTHATDMFVTKVADQHELDSCKAPCPGDAYSGVCCLHHSESLLVRQKARRRGYLVASVAVGLMSTDKCPHKDDMPKVKKALEYIKMKENLTNVPVIVGGFSAGGGFSPIVSARVNSDCTIIGGAVAREHGHKLDPLGFEQNFPNHSRVIFVRSTSNAAQDRDVLENKQQLDERGIGHAEIQGSFAGKRHFNYVGAYMDEVLDFCEMGQIPANVTNLPHLSFSQWQKKMGYSDSELFNRDNLQRMGYAYNMEDREWHQ